MLWMPWADYQKSYRSVALQLRSKIPVERAAASRSAASACRRPRRSTTMAASAPQPFDPLKPTACPLLLVQGSPQHEFDAPGAGWTKLADVGRPGRPRERYRLYRFRQMNTTPPTECPAWAELAHHAESWRDVHLRDLFANDVARGTQFVAEAPGVRYDYSRQRLGAMTLRLLAQPRRRARLRRVARRAALRQGRQHTENRAAWHTALARRQRRAGRGTRRPCRA